MRLAKLKRKYYDEKSKKWILKTNGSTGIIPTNIAQLESFDDTVFLTLINVEEVVMLDMTFEEAVKEINEALNHDPSVEHKIKHLEKRFKRDIDQVKSMTQGSCLGPNR